MKKYIAVILALLVCLSACTVPQKKPGPVSETQTEPAPTAPAEDVEALESEEESVKKTILFLAGLRISPDLQKIVTMFNMSNPRYEICTIDHAYETEVLSIGRTAMNTKLLAGRGPDLIYFGYVDYVENHAMALSPLPYIAKGFLMDLDPLLEEDPDLDAADIGPWNALHEYGGLYLLSPQYMLSSMYGTEAVFGDRTSWSIQEYLGLEASLDESKKITYGMTPEYFLEEMGGRYIRTAMDLRDASCDFDNSEFIALLNAADQTGVYDQAKQDKKDLADGSFVVAYERIGRGDILTLPEFPSPLQVAFDRWMAGDAALTYMGWPTQDGSCGTDVMLTAPVGICSQTEQVEGCWEFIKFMLLHPSVDAYHPNQNPTYSPFFSDYLKAVQNEESKYQATWEDVDLVLKLAEGSEHMYFYDEDVLKIIQEEASALFDGDTTAEEVARTVQARASLYMAEQYG